jgi:nicotinamidase-related amidase
MKLADLSTIAARIEVMNAPLLVIDLQTAMFDGASIPPIHQAGALVANVRAALAWARETGHPVAFIRHDAEPGDPLAPNEPGWPVWPALGQAEDEPTFGKEVGDAFSNPALEAWVRDQGATGVILLGAQSEFCVSATTKGALFKGFGVTLVGDAHSTWDADGQTADQIIEACNLELANAGAQVIPLAKLTGA